MLFRPLQAIALVAAITFFLPAHAVDSCNRHGNANLNQNTRTTIPGSECGDEGYFSSWGTLMILWPNKAQSTYNIVRRYAPELGGIDPAGYPHLVNRVYLEQKWRDANGAAGFPLNLKSEAAFNSFVANLEGTGYGRRCVFDLNGCYNSSSILVTDSAIPSGKECPASFYAGNDCVTPPVTPPDEDSTTPPDCGPEPQAGPWGDFCRNPGAVDAFYRVLRAWQQCMGIPLSPTPSCEPEPPPDPIGVPDTPPTIFLHALVRCMEFRADSICATLSK